MLNTSISAAPRMEKQQERRISLGEESPQGDPSLCLSADRQAQDWIVGCWEVPPKKGEPILSGKGVSTMMMLNVNGRH